MDYLVPPGSDFREIKIATARYLQYLESVRQLLPPNVYEFATADWRFDFRDHRCLHDSWVESVTVREVAGEADPSERHTEISLQLLGAYHDGHTVLSYEGVTDYQLSLRTPAEERSYAGRGATPSHGDWLVDEIRLAGTGTVVHEILFSSGARWLMQDHAPLDHHP